MTDVALRDYLEGLIKAAEQRASDRGDALLNLIQQRYEAHADQHGIHLTAHRDDHSNHLRVHERELVVSSDKVDVLDKRLDAMNEFRATLSDSQKTFVTRDMLDQHVVGLTSRIEQAFAGLNERLGKQENRSANIDGRIAMFAALPILLSAAGLVIALTK